MSDNRSSEIDTLEVGNEFQSSVQSLQTAQALQGEGHAIVVF